MAEAENGVQLEINANEVACQFIRRYYESFITSSLLAATYYSPSSKMVKVDDDGLIQASNLVEIRDRLFRLKVHRVSIQTISGIRSNSNDEMVVMLSGKISNEGYQKDRDFCQSLVIAIAADQNHEILYEQFHFTSPAFLKKIPSTDGLGTSRLVTSVANFVLEEKVVDADAGEIDVVHASADATAGEASADAPLDATAAAEAIEPVIVQESRCVVMWGLPYNVTDIDIRSTFERFGRIVPGDEGLHISRHRDDNHIVAYVLFEDPLSVNNAIEASPINMGRINKVHVDRSEETPRMKADSGKKSFGRGSVRR